jgi:hypothetical protein
MSQQSSGFIRPDNRLAEIKSDPPKKFSRFSDVRKFFLLYNHLAILPPTGSTSQEMMMAVNELGVIPKKKKFVWTDADENEMRDYCKITILNNSSI